MADNRHVVVFFFAGKNISLTYVIAYATDGAPAMIRHQRVFIAHLNNAAPTSFLFIVLFTASIWLPNISVIDYINLTSCLQCC